MEQNNNREWNGAWACIRRFDRRMLEDLLIGADGLLAMEADDRHHSRIQEFRDAVAAELDSRNQIRAQIRRMPSPPQTPTHPRPLPGFTPGGNAA